jgi:Ca2+-transporting ATPase
VLLVLFTPARIAFGLEILPLKLYLIALGLILVPLVVMEISKAIGQLKNKN